MGIIKKLIKFFKQKLRVIWISFCNNRDLTETHDILKIFFK